MQNLKQVLMTSSAVFFIFLLLALLLAVLQPHIKPDRFKLHDLKRDRNALINFIKSIKIPPDSQYKWNDLNESVNTCDFNGVTCGPGDLSVVALRLPAASLAGKIPEETIGMLYSLRTLSIHTNKLSGTIPDDFANLSELRYVYLHNNSFSGEFPWASSVSKWTNLVHLDLSNNKFTGTIPYNINHLKKLEALQLQNNSFHGMLPIFLPSSLKSENFSVSNNNFIGKIPTNLPNFSVGAFSDNIYLCDERLSKAACDDINTLGLQPPPVSPSLDHNNNEMLYTATIAVGSALILQILFSYLRKKLSRAVKEKSDKKKVVKEDKASGVATMARSFRGGDEEGTSSSKDDVTGAFVEGERNKLVSFDGGVYSFDLEDLLKASVEVAVLQEGNTVVVKRLKDVVVSKKEFDGVMEELGKMKNENVVPIRAYYYSKDEKLLVCDYFPAGSLSALLHGSRGSGRTHLDWDHRLRIALSAAKGVAYLHVAGKVVHGNIKSSNILLRQDSKKDASVSDFGLNTLFGGSSSSNTRANGYRAPEVLETRKVTVKSDVYSFGVLLLELLTGKAPNPTSLGEEGIDLPRWVKSVTRAEVFDVELMRYQNIEKEKDQLLQIAMACVSIVPDQRPAMQEVVRMMEDMNRAETDDGIV